MPIYEVSVELVRGSRSPASGFVENLSTLFEADGVADAIRAAVAWARNRADALTDDVYGCAFEIGCIKLHAVQIARPEPRGYIPAWRVPFHLFEWKHDWPGTLDQYVASAIQRTSQTAR